MPATFWISLAIFENANKAMSTFIASMTDSHDIQTRKKFILLLTIREFEVAYRKGKSYLVFISSVLVLMMFAQPRKNM